uniref:B-cell lymphoma/leukemia 10 n=1 Tax=Anser cygnoides TaxID=8845 RepID=A0A8B9EUP5_ANSCY
MHAVALRPLLLSIQKASITAVPRSCALERMRPYLCDKIIAERHFDYLRSKKILTREDTEEISSRSSSRKKTGKLLDYLAENPKGLDALIESIRRERTQNFLLQKITDVVLKVKNEKLEALKGTNNLSRSYSDESNFFDKTKDKESTQMHHPEEDYIVLFLFFFLTNIFKISCLVADT